MTQQRTLQISSSIFTSMGLYIMYTEACVFHCVHVQYITIWCGCVTFYMWIQFYGDNSGHNVQLVSVIH